MACLPSVPYSANNLRGNMPEKIPFTAVKPGTKVLILKGGHSTGRYAPGTVYTITKQADHYSDIYKHLPCFENNYCGYEYKILTKKPTIILE